MDAELKAKWVAALRSGKYKQGRKKLRSEDDCFCCLGVLCDISNNGRWEQIPFGRAFTYVTGKGVEDTYLSFITQREHGILDHHDKLIAMNDDDGKTFAEIADYIEQNV